MAIKFHYKSNILSTLDNLVLNKIGIYLNKWCLFIFETSAPFSKSKQTNIKNAENLKSLNLFYARTDEIRINYRYQVSVNLKLRSLAKYQVLKLKELLEIDYQSRKRNPPKNNVIIFSNSTCWRPIVRRTSENLVWKVPLEVSMTSKVQRIHCRGRKRCQRICIGKTFLWNSFPNCWFDIQFQDTT